MGGSRAGRRHEHSAADGCNRRRRAKGRLGGRAITTAVRLLPHRDGFGRRARGGGTARPTCNRYRLLQAPAPYLLHRAPSTPRVPTTRRAPERRPPARHAARRPPPPPPPP